jgi:hypothetical protein
MAIVIKKRARSPLAKGFVNTAIYPHGVGGIDGHEKCIGLEIGDIRIIMTKAEWSTMVESIKHLESNL